MALVIVACVVWGVLAVIRSGGPNEPPPPEPQIGGAVLQAHHIPAPPGLPIPVPEGTPPHVIGFVLGLIVFGIGWALCQ